jgi:hypothetical protein
MASIAAILEAARHGRAIGAVAGTWAALRADLADTSRRAADRATRARGDLQAQETADALAAIAWHFEPVSPAIDTPQIVFCQAATLAIRAKLAGDRASPAPTQLPPPSRQRPVQPGPLFGAAA